MFKNLKSWTISNLLFFEFFQFMKIVVKYEVLSAQPTNRNLRYAVVYAFT